MSVSIPWFELRERQLGALLAARTVGIVGAGLIGRRLIRLFRAFEARVLVFDPLLPAEVAGGLDAEARPLDEVLRESDIVSLHVPLLPETRRMIGAAEFALLRDGALFINTAKAGLVDQAAQLAALGTGRFTAALDVFDLEPLPRNHPLRALPNVILSPHAAGHTAESHLRQGDLAVDEICRFLAGEPLRHEITRMAAAAMA